MNLFLENTNAYYSWNIFNSSKNYKIKDLTSPNLKFLSIDKNPRLLVNSKDSLNDINFNSQTGLGLIKSNIDLLNTNMTSIYNNSTNYWNSENFNEIL